MAKYRVIYNPNAGNGNGKEVIGKLGETMKGDELSFYNILEIDSYKDFFAGITQNESIILSGGDGTINRFINDTKELDIKNDIYYFGSGNGNDFLHDIGHEPGSMPVKINEYIKNLPTVIVKGREYSFINGIGYGIDGYCCEVGDKLRSEGKEVNYTAIAIKGLLFHYKPTNAIITVDGVTRTYKKVWLAPTMHGRFYGGGMMPTPAQDRMGDENVNSVMVYFGVGKLKALMVFPSIFKGEHVNKTNMVNVFAGKEITVKFDRPVALQIDGETILNVTEYTVKANPLADRIVKSTEKTVAEV
ncbi:MAG: diacylglycerol kinase family protein [Eubacteriales bacterium]|nr:diacylglycerol kinase family protein [Eubacteriales bacterium]